MRCKGKLTILFIFSIYLIFSLSSYAVTEDFKALDIEESKEMLQENNLELLSIKRQIELQETIIEDTEYEAKVWKYNLNDDYEGRRQDNATKVFVNPIKEKNKLASLKRQYEDKVFELNNSLKQLHIDVINLDNVLNSLKKSLDIAESVYSQKSTEVSLGLLPEKDLLAYETSVKEVERDIKKAENDYQLKLFSINYLITGSAEVLFIPSTKNQVVLIDNDYIALDSIDIDILVENKLENNDTYQGYIELLEEYNQILYVERNYSTSGVASKKTLQDIENTELRIKDYKHKTKTEVIIAYFEMANKQMDIKIAKNNLVITENNLKVIESRYKLGLASSVDFLKGQLELINAERVYNEGLVSYDMQYSSFMRYY